MGFMDRAKKLAEQAKSLAEDALAEAKARQQSSPSPGPTSPATPGDPRMGTPYVPGMLGRPGWRELGLADPAALLPIDERDAAGVPRSTRSEIREEPFGMGRRWSAGGRSLGLYYQLRPEHRAAPIDAGGGRSLVTIAGGEHPVVLEAAGVDQDTVERLAGIVRREISAS